MNRALLEQPFEAALIKTRKGPFGGELSYVEAVHYIRRLNEAFDGRWTWRIENHRVEGAEVIVHGVLEAEGYAKHAFGGAALTTNKVTGEVVSLADDIKSAATDALKKACTLFGIGLGLYVAGNDPQVGALSPTPTPHLRPVPATQAHPGEARTTGPASAPPERNRLTAKQLRAIYAIAHAQGLTDGALKKRSIETYGAAPEFLSRSDASALIESLGAA